MCMSNGRASPPPRPTWRARLSAVTRKKATRSKSSCCGASRSGLRSAVGRVGIEPTTLGLRVLDDRLQLTAANRVKPAQPRFPTAASFSESRPAETSLYVVVYAHQRPAVTSRAGRRRLRPRLTPRVLRLAFKAFNSLHVNLA